MKRIYLLLLLTVSLAIFPQNSVFNSIKERKNLIVAITKSDQPPFFYVDKDGELKGFDIDIAKNMASKLGVGVIFNRDAES
ncbi:MAG: transporter substrate-binding domain-containing protein, partial [Spirochaetales bacterium]|nr:transporter substrate-binding domain-containing protein [Spirochaetales bacterium]